MSQKPELVMPGPMLASIMAQLDESFAVHRLWESPDREAALAGLSDARFAAAGGATTMDAALIARLPALEIIANFGVGYDGIDTRAAAARGIVVTNTPDVLTDEVADLAMGLLLMTVRELGRAERYLREGRWLDAPYPLTPGSLRGRTLGILGLGRIGLAIARRAEGFGLPVAYHNRSRRPELSYAYHASALDLARAVDTLVVVTPGGELTRHVVDAEVLTALGPQGVLVNVARGSVVDEAALLRALQDGTILGAGLDVFEDEPRVPSALLDCPNAVLLPHVGSASQRTRAAMGQLVVDNLLAWRRGEPPLTPVPETPSRR